MGMVLPDREEFGPYGGEVRSESFYLQGAVPENEQDRTPDHAIYLYPHTWSDRVGTTEMLIADIPEIRAVLDHVEDHAMRREDGARVLTVRVPMALAKSFVAGSPGAHHRAEEQIKARCAAAIEARDAPDVEELPEGMDRKLLDQWREFFAGRPSTFSAERDIAADMMRVASEETLEWMAQRWPEGVYAFREAGSPDPEIR